RKFEILRSLLHRPEVLFLDEPTAGLDPVSRRDLWGYLRSVQEESGTTVFLTTHYLEEAESADQVCVIAKGKVVANGTPGELRQRLVGRSQLILDSPDRAGLRAALELAGASFVENSTFDVVADATAAQHLIASIDVPLSLIRTHAPTLEDAYLDIVGTDADEMERVDG
ncbi:MAG: ABC transporter ATP-binding protein, partial [Mycobacteriales bacterium]